MIRHSLLAVLGAAGILAGDAAVAHDYTLGSLEIGDPYVAATPPTARAAAGYLSITNHGPEADRLIAVRSSLPQAQVHAVETDALGVTRMLPIDGLEIPPGATVTLAPQGLHVMFMGLEAPLAPGASVPATLVFERAGELAVEFKVEARKAGQSHGDSHEE